jgi:hypothetical protein
LLALACFCEDFFWFDLGDLSPIMLMAFGELTPLGHVSFSAGKSTLPAGVAAVNNRRTRILSATEQPALPASTG